MDKVWIGIFSAWFVALSIIPYGVRTYQNKIIPQFSSWLLFTIVGLATLITYRHTGADNNIWPAVFGFINPLVITFLVFKKNPKKAFLRLGLFEKISIFICGATLLAIAFIDNGTLLHKNILLAAVITANILAVAKTISFILKNPQEDRPVPWILLGIGYGLSMLAIEEHNFSNDIIPLYIVIITTIITFILTRYRLKKHVPLREWI